MKEDEPDENQLRSMIIEQLGKSLAMSREMMTNQKLDPKTRERWTQLHTNTAQVLNQILRDKQYKVWETRLKELEAAGHIPRNESSSSGLPSSDEPRHVSP